MTMIAADGFVTVEASYGSNGQVKGLRLGNVFQRYPQNPPAGSIVLSLRVDVSETLFAPVEVDLQVTADDVARGRAVRVVVEPIGGDDEG